MRDSNSRSKAAYDKKAADYDNTFDGKFTQEFKVLLLKKMRLPENARVLDVACGNGTLLKMLARKHGIQGFGIDLSPEMVRHAAEPTRICASRSRIASTFRLMRAASMRSR